MGWFLNLKTGHKLAASFGLCLLLACIVGVTSVGRLAQLNHAAELLKSDSVAGLESMQAITSDCKQYRLFQFKRLSDTNPAAQAKVASDIGALSPKIDQEMSDYEASITQDEDKANFEELKKRWSAYTSYNDQLENLVQKQDVKGTSQLMAGPMYTAFMAVSDQLETMSKWNAKRADTLANEAAEAYASARTIVIVLLTLAILVGVFMGTAVTRIIVGNLVTVIDRMNSLSGICVTNLGKAVEALENGDLTVKVVPQTKAIDVNSTDEFGVLATTFNTMLERTKGTIMSFERAQDALSTLIVETRNSADVIRGAADDVSAGNQDLSQRTEEQASSLEETAASMEEMTATVKQNADNSRQANQLAAHARELAEKGGSVVNDAVYAMGEINQGSKKISEIIAVIDEIAFQTNLLALNASVEAARVGEQGRGFAVVAAEVRNLAGRSATSAKEIKSLVNDTVQKVQDGSDLVNQSGSQLNEIVGAVKKVADIISEISAASIEQSAGIEQVNKAIMQMDQMTQQNAALVEEAAGTSASMAQLAQGLQQTVAKFKLDQKYSAATVQQFSRPVVQHAAATGTYGRPGAKSALSAKSNSRLKLVSHQSDVADSGKASAAETSVDDFEEF